MKQIVLLLFLGQISAHRLNRHQLPRAPMVFSEVYDTASMIQLYQHMADWDQDQSPDYSDKDLYDYQVIQMDEDGKLQSAHQSITKGQAMAAKNLKQQEQANVIKSQGAKLLPLTPEKKRQLEIQKEEAEFAKAFMDLGQTTQEYELMEREKKKQIQNLLKQAVEGGAPAESKVASKPAQNQIKLFQEDKAINKEPAAPAKAASAAPAAVEETKATAIVKAALASQQVPSISNTGDLFEQSQKLLSASQNLDNGKAVDIPAPLSNPKQIAKDVIKKHKEEQEKQQTELKERDEFSVNLYEMSKQLLSSANEIAKTDKVADKIKQRELEETQQKEQRALQKVREAAKLRRQQKQLKEEKALKKLEAVAKAAQAQELKEEEAAAVKEEAAIVVKKEAEAKQKVVVKEVSPDDPNIKAAAEIAADKIIENEKAMEQQKIDSQPKTLDEEVSSMVIKRANEVEKPAEDPAKAQLLLQAAAQAAKAAKEQAKAQSLAVAQSKEDRIFTPIKRTAIEAILHPSVPLTEEQQKSMHEAETASNSFLDRLQSVTTSPFDGVSISNPYEKKVDSSKFDLQDSHKKILEMQDASLGLVDADNLAGELVQLSEHH